MRGGGGGRCGSLGCLVPCMLIMDGSVHRLHRSAGQTGRITVTLAFTFSVPVLTHSLKRAEHSEKSRRERRPLLHGPGFLLLFAVLFDHSVCAKILDFLQCELLGAFDRTSPQAECSPHTVMLHVNKSAVKIPALFSETFLTYLGLMMSAMSMPSMHMYTILPALGRKYMPSPGKQKECDER